MSGRKRQRPTPKRPPGAATQATPTRAERTELPVYRLSRRWRARLWLGWVRPDWTRNYRRPS